MLGQCVFVIGFGQSECFVDAGGIALGHFGGCVGRSDGVCFGLAGLVGFSGLGRCQCAVNTIVNSAFVINVSVSEVASSAVASVVFSSS